MLTQSERETILAIVQFLDEIADPDDLRSTIRIRHDAWIARNILANTFNLSYDGKERTNETR